MVQTVKNPPTMQETQVQSLDKEDPLEKGMATHSNILAWEVPWTEDLGGLQATGSQSETQLGNRAGACTHTYYSPGKKPCGV